MSLSPEQLGQRQRAGLARRAQLVGLCFGFLTVLASAGIVRGASGRTKSLWRCRCVCGKIVERRNDNLRSGNDTSCGCRRGTSGRHLHNRVGKMSPTYRTWKSMKWRCRSRTSKYYGARGVSVCASWSASFEAFIADMGERPAGKTIDRYPDPGGNYEPGNCRWATGSEQALNKNPRTKKR